MKKRILSMLCAIVMTCSLCGVSAIKVEASKDDQVVDGSVLTLQEEASRRYTSYTRGYYMMEGDCSISKAGRGRIYVYGSTTANRTVARIGVTMFVEQYRETDDAWHQIDYWDTTTTNDYYLSTSKSITVERGYYYRVHAIHQCAPLDDPGDVGDSATDGIYIS